MTSAETPTPPPHPARHPHPSLFSRLRAKWRRWPLAIGEDHVFLLLAIVIGVLAGLSVTLFRMTIEWIQALVLGPELHPSAWRVLLGPTVAGLIVAVLVIHLFPRVRGSGVNQTKAAVYVFDGYVPFNTVIGKFITCAIAIGSGHSLGPEDPSLQIGAGIASKLGRTLKLSRDKIRLIAPVGAAAGLAAAFNAPISAVLFVIEEVIGNWSGGVLGAIVLAAVSSVVVMRQFLGTNALFRVPPFVLQHPSELLAYVVLGVIGGGASVLLLQAIAHVRPRLQRLPHWTAYIQPAVAGFLIGLIGLRVPQIMGAGYPVIDMALHDQFAWKMLLLLAACKIVATSLSFVSGTPGGMFAPTLFIGAMLGGAVGGVEHLFFHQISGTVGAFALVGMGTLFAGFLRVPITSVFMVIEVSGSYTAILPVMIANTIAYLISRQYQKTSLFDLLARQDGMVLPSVEEQRERVSLRVEDAMAHHGTATDAPEEAYAKAAERAGVAQGAYRLAMSPLGWRVVRTPADPSKAAANVKAVADRTPFLYPDLSLEDALQIMRDWPLAPVISRANPQILVGVLAQADILRAYREIGSLEPS